MARAARRRVRRLNHLSWCQCPDPLVDSDVDVDEDDDFCWRCGRPLPPEEDDE